MALTGALCHSVLSVDSFTHQHLRALTASLWQQPYGSGQMTYDLRRLQTAGLIQRLPRQNRYVLTEDGLRIAIVYSKLHNRLLRSLLADNAPQVPIELRQAFSTIHRHIDRYAQQARIKWAA